MKKRNNGMVYALIFSLLIAPFGTVFSGGTAASATARETSSGERMGEIRLIQEGEFVSASVGETSAVSTYSARQTAQELLYEGLCRMDEAIDISQYNLSQEQFMSVLEEVLNASPELFYVGGKVRGSQNAETGNMVQYKPEYLYDAGETEQMKTRFEDVVSRVVAGVDSSWSDMEKALYIHDYLTAHCEYDETLTKFDAYSLLVEGTAVCQGYSLAYLYFMKQLGIPCVTVPSRAMEHMWNQVQIDGKWYHVDVTYDDPLPDMPGMARHDFLLLSDTMISSVPNMEHSGWNTGIVCEDTSYDGADTVWGDSLAPFVFDGTSWYYVNTVSVEGGALSGRGGIYRWDVKEGKSDKMLDLSDELWNVSDTAAYPTKFTGLVYEDGKLYYNTSDSIKYFDLMNPTGQNTVEVPVIAEGEHLFGVWEAGGILKCAVGTAPDKITEKRDVLYLPVPTVTPTVTPAATPTVTPAVTPAATPAVTPAVTPAATPAVTPAATPVVTPAATPVATPAVTPAATPTVTPAATPTVTPAATPTVTPTATPTVTPVATPAVTPAATPAVTPAATPTVTPTATPTVTPAVTPAATPTVTPAATPTVTPVATPVVTPAVTPAVTPVATPAVTPAVTPTATPTATPDAVTESGFPQAGGGIIPVIFPVSSGIKAEPGKKKNSSVLTMWGDNELVFVKQEIPPTRIIAKKGKKKITIRTPENCKVVVRVNKKILRKKKKRVKRYTVTAEKNKSGKIVLRLSSKLRKKMRVSVTIYWNGQRAVRSVTIK